MAVGAGVGARGSGVKSGVLAVRSLVGGRFEVEGIGKGAVMGCVGA